jgi:organic hydroperoxide reductase OsmC/OhrA
MDEVQGIGHRIVASELSARGVVPGCHQAGFAEAAEEADRGCPISALIKASATVTVEATLNG